MSANSIHQPRKINAQTGNAQVDRLFSAVQDAIGDAMAPIVLVPFLAGVALKGVALGVATTKVRHGLVDERGRPRAWEGFFVTRNYGTTLAYVGEAATQSDVTRTIDLRASASTTVDLWVY